MIKVEIKCEECGEIFDIVIKNKGSYKRRFCDKCSCNRKSMAGKKGAFSKNPIREPMDVINLIASKLLEHYRKTGKVLTKIEVCEELNISSKTLSKIWKETGMTYCYILSSLNIQRKGASKFQNSVYEILKIIYPNSSIETEKQFDGMVNPKTNRNLRIDFFIEDLNLAIECDGLQHLSKEHYFNMLTESQNNTTCIVTDKIKEEYLISKKINLIRIPYNKKITLEYIQRFLY